ncbi:hypothetical protein OIN60_20490 [Paenibacillus sp. P96]|uniref:DUF6843 domain-containing protein n=1 Tax=Paenibacillus zeirhizosphaerae TaxID=2987519 RepID=A0ABT9FWJ7_9BACL|nr:hypothetical protein [Paenibacillus sp. P96]MDP4099106.1 hypothetical protein [Paenibacillus sp. P96]
MRKMTHGNLLLVLAAVLVVTACIVAGSAYYFSKTDYPTHKFLLPKGFTGWIEVTFEQPGAPALKKEGERTIVYEVPESGKIMTSSKNTTGTIVLYYVETDGSLTEFPTNKTWIHGLGTSSGGRSGADDSEEKSPEKLNFFVGTEEQWENAPTP